MDESCEFLGGVVCDCAPTASGYFLVNSGDVGVDGDVDVIDLAETSANKHSVAAILESNIGVCNPFFSLSSKVVFDKYKTPCSSAAEGKTPLLRDLPVLLLVFI